MATPPDCGGTDTEMINCLYNLNIFKKHQYSECVCWKDRLESSQHSKKECNIIHGYYYSSFLELYPSCVARRQSWSFLEGKFGSGQDISWGSSTRLSLMKGSIFHNLVLTTCLQTVAEWILQSMSDNICDEKGIDVIYVFLWLFY